MADDDHLGKVKAAAEEVHAPADRVASGSHISSMAQYQEMHRRVREQCGNGGRGGMRGGSHGAVAASPDCAHSIRRRHAQLCFGVGNCTFAWGFVVAIVGLQR